MLQAFANEGSVKCAGATIGPVDDSSDVGAVLRQDKFGIAKSISSRPPFAVDSIQRSRSPGSCRCFGGCCFFWLGWRPGNSAPVRFSLREGVYGRAQD